MTLSFLTPRPSERAPARSPLIDAARSAGAVTEVREGWEVITSFGDSVAEAAACAETVGFADSSSLAKVEISGRGGTEFTPGIATRADGGWRCPVRRDRTLLLAGAAAVPATEGEATSFCDLSAALGALVLVGPAARETFARFCALDLREPSLPVCGFRPGSIARTPGYLLREEEDRFLMLFGSAFAEYVWEVVADAAGRLGGRPVGSDSLPAARQVAASA